MKGNLLDTVSASYERTQLVNLEPARAAKSLLAYLKSEREREILSRRFGLDGQDEETLEALGKRVHLTRERVRQIEKQALYTLEKLAPKPQDVQALFALITEVLLRHGKVMGERDLFAELLANHPGRANHQGLLFLLHIGDQYRFLPENRKHRSAWSLAHFPDELIGILIGEIEHVITEGGKPLTFPELAELLTQRSFWEQAKLELNAESIRSIARIAKSIAENPFGAVGLCTWADVVPRDVGDKAYLILRHEGEPLHYSRITEFINEAGFDRRIAHKETVHNELIRDSRFVLVGRGMYALVEWGYKKGIVSDVIRELLVQAGKPLTRQEIIDGVLRVRFVKRNTIIVGLSNKKLFRKVGRDRYALVETNEHAESA